MNLVKIIYYITLIYILSITSISIFIDWKTIEILPFMIYGKFIKDIDNFLKLVTGNFKGLKLFNIVTNYFIVIIISVIIYLLHNYINSIKNTKNKIKRKSYLLNWL